MPKSAVIVNPSFGFCSDCGSPIYQQKEFCSKCGAKLALLAAVSPGIQGSRAHAARGFGQIFGIDPRIAFLTFVVDAMLFGGTIATMGVLAPLALAAGIVLALITYKAQMHWYRDDSQSALIKALIIGLLTAIPVGLPVVLLIPSSLVGLIHVFRRR